MLWKTPRPLHIPPAPQPVPNAHALRLAALQSSWRRDRWVARRRVALRWVLWVLGRYGLYAMGTVAAAWAAWLWLVPLATPEPPPKVDINAAMRSAAAADEAFVTPPLYFDTALHSQEP
jgi:hypothetical protein